ncbi:hypothetical protein HDU91_001817 [Kappamyces sp. JEL0680]|nr:hypothetical protein HDU91_001817 [Kappamyces sp. JEL0680]
MPSFPSISTFAHANQQNLIAKFFTPAPASTLIYLRAQTHHNRKWTDAELAFRQESNFLWISGCHEPDFIFTLDPATRKTWLFLPDYEPDHALWMGAPMTAAAVKSTYQVTEVATVSSLSAHLDSYQTIHVLEKAELQVATKAAVDDQYLVRAMQETRVCKTEHELAFMREAGRVSAEAHVALMKAIKSYRGKSEKYFASLFAWECARQGGHVQAYGSIVGAGTRGAILHSSPTLDPIACSPHDLCLVDAGCEINCYASDITRTYPFGGVFEGDYKTIYQLTLDANKAVIAAMKPGVKWEDMHRLAEDVILKGLVQAQIVVGSLEELRKHSIAALFFPHGLGHLLGLDVHDSPLVSYPPGVDRIPEPGIKYLRMRRPLEVGMVITVEPGIYFVDAILDKALALSKFLNVPVLERFKRVGGVRIEDNVLVKADGLEILSAGVPKEIHEIEALMK